MGCFINCVVCFGGWHEFLWLFAAGGLSWLLVLSYVLFGDVLLCCFDCFSLIVLAFSLWVRWYYFGV